MWTQPCVGRGGRGDGSKRQCQGEGRRGGARGSQPSTQGPGPAPLRHGLNSQLHQRPQDILVVSISPKLPTAGWISRHRKLKALSFTWTTAGLPARCPEHTSLPHSHQERRTTAKSAVPRAHAAQPQNQVHLIAAAQTLPHLPNPYRQHLINPGNHVSEKQNHYSYILKYMTASF